MTECAVKKKIVIIPHNTSHEPQIQDPYWTQYHCHPSINIALQSIKILLLHYLSIYAAYTNDYSSTENTNIGNCKMHTKKSTIIFLRSEILVVWLPGWPQRCNYVRMDGVMFSIWQSSLLYQPTYVSLTFIPTIAGNRSCR